MKVKLTGSSYSLIVVMAIGLAIIALALGMPIISRLLPLICGSLIFILAAIKLWYDIWAGKRVKATIEEDEVEQMEESKVTLHSYLPIIIWILGCLLAIYLLGLLVACPLLVFSYMKTHGTSWLKTIITTIIFILIVYFGFQTALEIDLYPGLLFKWISS